MRTHLLSLAGMLLIVPLYAVPAYAQELPSARYKFAPTYWRKEQSKMPRMSETSHAVSNGVVNAPNGAGIDPSLLAAPARTYSAPPQPAPIEFSPWFGAPRATASKPAVVPPAQTMLQTATLPPSISAPLHKSAPNQRKFATRLKGKLSPPAVAARPAKAASYPANVGYQQSFGTHTPGEPAEVKIEVRGKVLAR